MPLPDFLIDRYRDWKNNSFVKKSKIYKDAESNGQKPKAMIVTCCDSRVHPIKIFNAEIGDFFIHKNIANLIPRYYSNSDHSETLAAIEYGVKNLKISEIIILGHSKCGGIEHAHNYFSDKNNTPKNLFIDSWIQNIKPAYLKLDSKLKKENQIQSLEKLSIINSISNLKKIPIIKELALENKIRIHGLWFEIATGKLMYLDDKSIEFETINY